MILRTAKSKAKRSGDTPPLTPWQRLLGLAIVAAVAIVVVLTTGSASAVSVVVMAMLLLLGWLSSSEVHKPTDSSAPRDDKSAQNDLPGDVLDQDAA